MAAAHYSIDLGPRRRTAPRLAVLWVAASLLALAWATSWTLPWMARYRETELLVARWRAAQARPPAPSARPGVTPAEQRLRRDLDRIAADLNRPWPELLEALERSKRPGVQLLQLAVDGGFGRLQLQVQARDLAELLQYLRVLDAAGAPLAGAELLGHEAVVAEGAAVSGSPVLLARLGVSLRAAELRATADAPAPSAGAVAAYALPAQRACAANGRGVGERSIAACPAEALR